MKYSIVADGKVLVKDLSLIEAEDQLDQMKKMIMAGIATNYSEQDLEIRCHVNK
jgi:hypothetical protein|tara:strand:+ start:651 stop:812 length:162 start_codon:yes stop_codon:yes gene_type:complete